MLARLILRALLWPLWVRSCKCSFSCLLKFTTYFFFTTASLHQFGIVVGGKFIPFIYCGEVLGPFRLLCVIQVQGERARRQHRAWLVVSCLSEPSKQSYK